ALLGRLEQVDAAQHRALARAARPDHADDLASGDIEVDPAQNLEIAEALVDPLQSQHRLRHLSQATSMCEPRATLSLLRAMSLSTSRAAGRMITRNIRAPRVSAEALKVLVWMSVEVWITSFSAITLTSVVSFSRAMSSFSIGAGILRTACGTITLRIDWRWLMPSDRAASIWPPGTASMPAR